MPYLSILHRAVYIGLSPLFEPLFGLDRESKGHVLCAVENLKQIIADQAAKFAIGPGVLRLARSGDSQHCIRDR